MRPAHFNRRSWRELQQHFKNVSRVAARLTQKVAADGDNALFATIAARKAQTGQTTRQIVVQLVREMRAAKKAREQSSDVAPNTCPYCGGSYSISRTCNGPRDLSHPEKGTCMRMAQHARLVRAAIEAEEVGS